MSLGASVGECNLWEKSLILGEKKPSEDVWTFPELKTSDKELD